MTELRVLVTGFGPFPGMPENSSAWLVDSLGVTARRAACQPHTLVFPTEWAAVSQLAPRLLDTVQPHIALHFGVSHRAASFRIERFAHNEVNARADASGAVPDATAIVAGGADCLSTSLPAHRLAQHLNTCGVRASPSGCAGRYLCNFLYYLSLDWAERQAQPCVAAFVHMPPRPADGGPFSEADLLHGADRILDFMIAFAREQEQPRRVQTRTGPSVAWDASATKDA